MTTKSTIPLLDQLGSISLGTAGIAGLYRETSYDTAQDVLAAAWDEGIRYFDTAPHYGQGLAERRVGDFLRGKSDYVLSTKVGRILKPASEFRAKINGFVNPPPFDQHYDYSYDGIMRSVEDSYQRLGLNRIDILYVHDVGTETHGADAPRHISDLLGSGWKALEELKASGAIKAVGLGVNEVEVCLEVARNVDMDVILLAGRYTLLDNDAANTLLPTCREKNIRLVIGGVFNSGILATGPKPGATFNYQAASDDILARAEELQSVCRAHDTALPQAALHFAMQEPLVASTLIGVSHPDRLRSNMVQARAKPPAALWTDLANKGLIPA
ncbi:aldo/keto reductase [Devosia rhodophyticola]|uniref:Aldo/keto reductase n=1 Tax=Devosia rhodophyticola TaxID=3026423 RepID=A0ABY7YWI2_9HYPH|nr:aldo/keto reductase [Devosia rhodophyticola]WDR05205.1 aldo/keto reductase [Devosia rhodophyticola]